jgi:NAD(P)-dependent dehydrogenase (short-subunit alcohol dehydrogenase family)
MLTARSELGVAKVAREIREHGAQVETAVGSVADPAVIDRCVEIMTTRWGCLDVLINNAGISPAFVRSERLAEVDWHEVLDVNLFAPFATCRAALPLFEAAGAGSVVNISSIHGTRAHERLIAYAASKGGLEMVTRTLAIEWAPKCIRVNSVAPGYLETDMTSGLRDHERWSDSLRRRIPLGRFGPPHRGCARSPPTRGTRGQLHHWHHNLRRWGLDRVVMGLDHSGRRVNAAQYGSETSIYQRNTSSWHERSLPGLGWGVAERAGCDRRRDVCRPLKPNLAVEHLGKVHP